MDARSKGGGHADSHDSERAPSGSGQNDAYRSIKGAIFNAVEKRSTGYYSYGYYEYSSNDKT